MLGEPVTRPPVAKTEVASRVLESMLIGFQSEAGVVACLVQRREARLLCLISTKRC